MAKEFSFRGRTADELKSMSVEEFMKLIPSRERRKIKRGFTDVEKKFIERLKTSKKPVKTHCRDVVILPEMIGKSVKIHNGKEWVAIDILPEMAGHRLGEFAITRKSIKHSSPGIGATRSSAALSVR